MAKIHKKLPGTFKVILDGDRFPRGYQNGDRLEIENWRPHHPIAVMLQCDRDVLIKKDGRHEIHRWKKNKTDTRSAGELIGVIETLERSCNEDMELGLPEAPDFLIWPPACEGCGRAEFIECTEGANVYCRTDHGFERTYDNDTKCRRGLYQHQNHTPYAEKMYTTCILD